MKLTFINTSKFMIRAFQVVIIGAVLFGLSIIWLNEDTSTNLTFGPLAIQHGHDLTRDIQIGITPLTSDLLNPKIIVDEARVTIPVYSSSTRNIIAVLFLVTGITAFFGLQQSFQMVHTLEQGNPFIRSNVWRIYILSTVIFMMIPVLNMTYKWIAFRWINSNFALSGLTLEWSTPDVGVWVLFGTLLITIGKIFEQGVKLKEEQELTV